MKSSRMIAGIFAVICLCFAVGLIILEVHSMPYAWENLGIRREVYFRIYRQADADYSAGNYQRALEEYGQMISMHPSKCDGYQKRAQVESQLNRYDQAIADDTKGIEVLSTRNGIDEVGYDRNISYVAKQKIAHETQVMLYGARAQMYIVKHNTSSAIADYTAALSINPKNADVRRERAKSYLTIKQYDHALSDCQANLTYSPSASIDYDLLGETYQMMHKNALAFMAFSTAVKLDPHNIDYYIDLSRLYEQRRDYRSLVRIWHDACIAMPEDADARGGYGWAQYLNGNYGAAIVNSRKAITMNAHSVYARYNIGICYAMQDDWRRSNAAYKDAYHASLCESAGQYSGKDDITDALNDIQTALKSRPASQALKYARSQLRSYLASPVLK